MTMEWCHIKRDIAVIESCAMTVCGLRQLFCQMNTCELHIFQDYSSWLSQPDHPRYYAAIYSVAQTRDSRLECVQFLSVINQQQPEAIRILLAEDRHQANLVHHLSPVLLHAVISKSDPLAVLQRQMANLLTQTSPVLPVPSSLIKYAGGSGLSPSEQVLLYYLSQGLSIPEIAAKMARNTKTIRTHKFNVMTKLGVRSDLGLLRAVDILHDTLHHLQTA